MKEGRPKGTESQGISIERRDLAGPGKSPLIQGPTAPTAPGRGKPLIPADREPPKTARATHGPLEGAKARQFGDRLGADFSGVQIHTGDGVAQDHGAAAVAFGRDIHFADGMAGGEASDALLGHELVHTLQQGAAPMVGGAPLTAGTHATAEAEADRVGAAAASGVPGRVTVRAPAGTQRKPRQRPADLAGGVATTGDNAAAHATKTDALVTTPSPQVVTRPAPSHPSSPPAPAPPAHRPGAAPAKPTKPATSATPPGSRAPAAAPQAGAHAGGPATARGPQAAIRKPRPALAQPRTLADAVAPAAASRSAPAIHSTAPGGAAAHALLAEGQQHAAQLRGASRVTAASIRARVAAEVARLHAAHATQAAALDGHITAAHGEIAGHTATAHGAVEAGRSAAHAHLTGVEHAQIARVDQAGQQQHALAPQVIAQHGGEIDAHAASEAARFDQGASARTQQVQQGGGGSSGETADKHAELTAKVSDRAATSFSDDASKVSGETQRAAGEFHGALDQGAANFTGALDQMVPQFTSGITSAASATRTGADGVATQATTAMAQLATHAGTRLEDDAAAAHTGLTRDADAASAALHAHGEHQATQIVTDADRVADAVVEHVHAIARAIADAPGAHGAALASEARGQLTAHTSQATTQIAAADGRVTGGLTAHAAAGSASLATTGSQASAHVQTAAAKVGQHLAHAGSHTAAGLQSKAQLAGQQIQGSAGQATDHLDRAGAEFTGKAAQASAGARTKIAGTVDTASADQQTHVGTFTSKQRDAGGQLDTKHDQLKAEADHQSQADQAQNTAQSQTFLDWLLPKSWTDAIKHWFASAFGDWWGGFLWGVINALLVVAVVVAVCVIFPVAAPFIVGGLLIAGAALGIYSRFKTYEAYHDGNGPGFWSGLALVGLGIADITGIPSIVEGCVGARAFNIGHQMSKFESGESVGSGLVNLLALIIGGGRALRGKRGGVTVKPLDPLPPELPPEVKVPDIKPPDGNAPEVKPPDGKTPDPVPDPATPPRPFTELLTRLSAKAQEAVTQQRELRSADNMAEMEGIGRNPDGTYDVAKANKGWEKQWMDDAKFQAARAKLVGELGTKARGELDQIKNICDDNDGTSRPNAKVGDGTTEAALRAEAETGKPVGDVGGHAEKATDAVRTLQALVTALRGRKENLGSDPALVTEIDASIARALQRITALRGGLDVWNNRATLFPKIWNPDGTLRNPIGPVSPLPPTPPDQDHQDGGAP